MFLVNILALLFCSALCCLSTTGLIVLSGLASLIHAGISLKICLLCRNLLYRITGIGKCRPSHLSSISLPIPARSICCDPYWGRL